MEILGVLPEWIQAVLTVLGSLVVIGTAIARVTKTKKDDELVVKMESFWSKAVMFLPTLGINPKTKALKEALKEAKEK